MAGRLKSKCAKCGIQAKDCPTLPFHRFPNPSKRCVLRPQVWAVYCFPDGDWTSAESIRTLHSKHSMLCGNHFDESSYTCSNRKRLNKFAIPKDAQNILRKLHDDINRETETIEAKSLSNVKYVQRSSYPDKITNPQLDIRKVIGCKSPTLKYGILVLNRPISQRPDFMKKFWNDAWVRITVDGGTYQWDKFLKSLAKGEQQSIKLPDLVTGDFDSITDEMLQDYKEKGCKIIHTPDQDHTDFTKALMELNKYCTEHNTVINHAVAIAQASGRIDQILGNVQTLYLAKLKQLLPTTKIYLMSDDAVSWLLFPGENILCIPEETRTHKKSWCSLVPIGDVCESVTTSGLKWNLNNTKLKFGELVSTSNAFDGSETVKIQCSHTILWSMKMPGIC